jgi:protein involved in polysaccharide export with SLBB domain
MFALWGALPAVAQTYLLGPEDVVSLRVVTWDDASASYVPMEGITGEYKVSVSGAIALPVVGRIQAVGITPEDLSESVAEALKTSAGLFQLPVVSLEISTYRPFYIAGDVNNPGAYAWRPQLTASKALALAGGTLRTRDASVNEASIYRDISSLQSVQVELVRMRAREARLEAELTQQTEITFHNLQAHPDGPEAVELIKQEERSILETRLASYVRSTQSNEALIALHETELAGLQGKLEGQRLQIESAREQTENLRTLVERGTVPASRVLSAERTLLDLSAEELDLNTAIFRARQRIGETQRDQLQMVNDRENDVLRQLQDTRRRIELDTKRESMLVGLAALSGVQPVDVPVELYMQVRRPTADGGSSVLPVGPDDAVLPGDVFEVQLRVGVDTQ